MASMPMELWVLVALVGGAAVLSSLYSLGVHAARHKEMHDLCHQAVDLQNKYLIRRGLAEGPEGSEMLEAEILDDGDGADAEVAGDASSEETEQPRAA